jgi:hypothetical protein
MVNTRSRQPSEDPQDQDQAQPHIQDLDTIEEEEPQDEAQQQMKRSPPTSPPRSLREHTREPNRDDQLTQALLLLTQELRRREGSVPVAAGKRPKAKEPDTFDGSDPKKLNNFILLCNLYFRTSSAYSDDTAKVNFALSYLRGMALEYFEPTIIDSDDFPVWIDNWDAFVLVLRSQFGPLDPTADAENAIDNLKMMDNQKIIKYNVEFTRFSVRTGWNDAVLRYRYYTGLAERIKDVMSQQGKPNTLEDMKRLAQSIDARHWERLREKSRTSKGKSDDKPDPKSDKGNKSDDKGKSSSSNNNNSSSNNNNNNKNKNNKSGKATSSSGSNSGSSSGSSNPLADKLGKDGKLTPQERQRRFDNNLCMFCGGPGHTAANCSKATSSSAKAKARAAQAKEKSPPAGDSKKV